MPTPDQLLRGLAEISNRWTGVAIGWHVILAAIIAGLLLGKLRGRRTVAVLAGLPLLSASVFAWIAGNPFNGSLLGLFALILLAIALRLRSGRIRVAAPGLAIPGVLLLAFGWVYPHFLHPGSFARYLYAAPTGLIPCPTLSVVVGSGLLLASFGSRAWGLVAGVVGLFYGVFGAARLGVTMDWVLAAGSLGLIVATLAARRAHSM